MVTYFVYDRNKNTYLVSFVLKLIIILNFENLNYNMINGPIENQEIFAKQYTAILNAREDIMNNNLPQSMGTKSTSNSDARSTNSIVSFLD